MKINTLEIIHGMLLEAVNEAKVKKLRAVEAEKAEQDNCELVYAVQESIEELHDLETALKDFEHESWH